MSRETLSLGFGSDVVSTPKIQTTQTHTSSTLLGAANNRYRK